MLFCLFCVDMFLQLEFGNDRYNVLLTSYNDDIGNYINGLYYLVNYNILIYYYENIVRIKVGTAVLLPYTIRIPISLCMYL